jgi:hypothetical protein
VAPWLIDELGELQEDRMRSDGKTASGVQSKDFAQVRAGFHQISRGVVKDTPQ